MYFTGTAGSIKEIQLLQDYAMYIANLFFLTSDTVAPIVKDVDLTPAMAGNKFNITKLNVLKCNEFSNNSLVKFL